MKILQGYSHKPVLLDSTVSARDGQLATTERSTYCIGWALNVKEEFYGSSRILFRVGMGQTP